MDFHEGVNKVIGSALVKVEGFFTERVINLCKMQNIKIWNVKNITSGMIEFEILVKDIKKLKVAVKKCKCKFKVVKKSGMYFKAFKYRKRKIVIIMTILLLIGIIVFNKFVWNIDVEGNEIISKDEVLSAAKKSGIYIGAYKPKLDINYIVKCLKKELKEATWVGIELKGNNIIIKVTEKTKIPEEIIYDKSKTGNIVAKKSGVITKIVAENGTAVLNTGSYVETGMNIIEGKMLSQYLGEMRVRASGIVKANVEYEFKKNYYYKENIKEYIGKEKYSIGFSINNKEFYINYLNKTKKYDTLKESKTLNIFGMVISFDFYRFKEYEEVEKINSYEELLYVARSEKDAYKNSIVNEKSEYVSETENINEIENGFEYKSIIVLNEDIGTFKGD